MMALEIGRKNVNLYESSLGCNTRAPVNQSSERYYMHPRQYDQLWASTLPAVTGHCVDLINVGDDSADIHFNPHVVALYLRNKAQPTLINRQKTGYSSTVFKF